MILYLTRKFPPSVGGMQKFHQELSSTLAAARTIRLVSWGGSQVFLPFFLAWSFAVVVLYALRRKLSALYLGDALLCLLVPLVRLFTRAPVVVTVHGLDVTWAPRAYQAMVLYCLKRCHLVVCVSSRTMQECLDRGVPADRCVVINNGIHVHRYNDPIVPHNRTLQEIRRLRAAGHTVLLTVGRLIRRKGVRWFVEEVLPQVHRSFPNTHYFVVGTGPMQGEIQAAIESQGLGKRVHLLGYVSEEVLKGLYRQTDVVVLPNVAVPGDVEGFGIVALEAQASGCCVVAADIDGVPDAVIDGFNGFLVPAGDKDSFAGRICGLLDAPTDRENFGKQARAFARRHYDWDNIVRCYLSAFDAAAEIAVSAYRDPAEIIDGTSFRTVIDAPVRARMEARS